MSANIFHLPLAPALYSIVSEREKFFHISPESSRLNMVTNKNSSTLLLVGVSTLSLVVFGIGLMLVGVIMPIPSFYEPTSASRLESLPQEWSMKVWEGIGQVQVVLEDHRKVLRLETEKGCISLFRSLRVNFWP